MLVPATGYPHLGWTRTCWCLLSSGSLPFPSLEESRRGRRKPRQQACTIHLGKQEELGFKKSYKAHEFPHSVCPVHSEAGVGDCPRTHKPTQPKVVAQNTQQWNSLGVSHLTQLVKMKPTKQFDYTSSPCSLAHLVSFGRNQNRRQDLEHYVRSTAGLPLVARVS